MCIGQPPTSMLAGLQGSSACALLLMKDNYYIYLIHIAEINMVTW